MPRHHVFEFLESTPTEPTVAAIYGNVSLLRGLGRKHFLDHCAADADVTYFDGAKAAVPWRDVRDEMATGSLFSQGKRYVWIRDADDFVSQNRRTLETYLELPLATSVLVLELSAFAANTNVYRRINEIGLIVDCREPLLERRAGKPAPDMQRIAKWLCWRAQTAYQCQLELTGAQAMLELVGLEFGLLDQELARLALFAEVGAKMTAKDVRKHCGGWRSQTTWTMLDAMLDGDVRDAMLQLHQLLLSGEVPNALFGQISWSLRRFAVAVRLFRRAQRHGDRMSLTDALKQAGFQPFLVAKAEKQLRRLGAARAGLLADQLMELDLALKGSHSHGTRARFALEQLVLQIAKP
ncbi:MAG: DNA polymerase III subunit delta [Planctomycetales bacterium]|nr:DNA polymerase III subunit delta [Planctomycetales bacterium]